MAAVIVVTEAGRPPEGATVRAWVDREGRVVDAPLTSWEAVVLGVSAGVGIAILGGLVLGSVWLGLRRWLGIRERTGMDDRRVGRAVVAGVDGSERSLQAVRWAAREAARRRAPLRLVAAVGWVTAPHQYGDPRTGPDLREVLLRQARVDLGEAAQAAAAAASGPEPELEVLDGFPVVRLADESRAAQLVVIGDRGMGGVPGLLVGSVAVGLAAHGGCPVVVVRGRWDATGGPVVVGVDGSPVSEAALAFASEAAASRRAPLLAVHAWRELLIDPVTMPSLDWAVVEQEEQAELGERLAGWQQKYPDVDVQRLVVRDRPARVLVEQSAHAQLVVVGSHGHGGLAGLVLGSIGHAVLHRADCPVAIVRPDVGAGAQ